MKFLSQKNEKCEQDLLELLEQSKGNGRHIDSLDADRLLHKVITEKNLTPNEEQVNAILTCITSKNSYVAVQGLAGTGKTYFVNIMREMCDRSNIKIKGAAFAGAAADELANDTESLIVTLLILFFCVMKMNHLKIKVSCLFPVFLLNAITILSVYKKILTVDF